MESIEKRFQINENRILIYKIIKEHAIPSYMITEGFMENDQVVKTYNLCRWDDYGLNGWIDDDDEVKNISFDFDINHPLYYPLLHLLNNEDELLIDDDSTREYNKNYMLVHKDEDKIYIDFIDERPIENHIIDRFHVFIKNILYDGRSKIDQNKKDTKERLYNFFNEVNSILINDNYQISNDESKQYKKEK